MLIPGEEKDAICYVIIHGAFEQAIERSLGSTIQAPVLARTARAIGVVDAVCWVFKKGYRKREVRKAQSLKDHTRILEQLLECRVYSHHKQKSHIAQPLKHWILIIKSNS